MKRIVVTLSAVVLCAFAAPAGAAAPGSPDQFCGYAGMSGTGVLWGGPILQNGTMRCTIQVGGSQHSDADNGTSASATGTNGTTTIPPRRVAYVGSPGGDYLCDQFTDVAGVTWYFDGVTNTWVTNSAVACRPLPL